MVIFSKCQRTARNHRIYSDLPMSGEDTGLGSSVPALAGYLGKVQERSASLENCPWCAAKGLTCVLRSYRINFQESITLCTSPQCLFPLVSRPLEDVLARLVPPEPQTGAKRRTPWPLEGEDPVPRSKRLRSEEESDEEASLQNGNPISQPGPTDMEVADQPEDSDWLAPEGMDQEVVQGDEETVAIPEKMAPSPDRVGLRGRLLSPAQDALARVQTIVLSSEYESDSEVEFICLQKNSSGPPKAVTSSITSPAAVLTSEEESDSEVELISLQKNASGPPKAVTSAVATPAAVSTSENGDSLPAEANFTSEAVVQSKRGRRSDSLSGDRAEGQVLPVCRPCSVDLSQSRLDWPENLAEPARDPTRAAKTPRRSSENIKDEAEDMILKDDEPSHGGGLKGSEGASVNMEDEAEDMILKDDEQSYGGGLTGSEITKITPSVDTLIGSKELVLVSPRLFWRNEPNLAWLDSLLVALVNCRALKEKRPKTQSSDSVVWELCTIYDKCCALISQRCQDGIIKVPAGLRRKVTEDLEALRMFVFNALQPKLQQGKEDSLVLALPLLLKMDSWAEHNFHPIFDWACLSCGKPYRVKKLLTTLKTVVSDWNPLKSTIKGRCSGCGRKRLQEKKLIMKSVPPVFALHFEKGLPDTEVGKYSFDFDQHHYHVTTVIQYSKQHKHYVTWIRKPSDSWLEFDGLKHPHCVSHRDLSLPAQDVHIVFWEKEEEKDEPHKRLRDVDPAESDSPAPYLNRSLEAKDFLADEPVESDDLSQDEAGIVAALTPSDAEDAADRAAGGDASIGSATLLDTFEGLSHDDIVTLTLVEVNDDSKGKVPASAPRNRRRASSRNSPKPASRATPSQPGELILPSVVSSACHLKSSSVETGQCVSPVSSSPSPHPSSARLPWQRQVDISPLSVKTHPLSPSLAKPSALANNTSTPVAQTKPPLSNSSSGYTQRPQPPPRPSLKVMENEALPLKAAERYGGFCTRSTNNPYQTLFLTKGATQSAASKVPFQRASPAPPKPAVKPTAVSMTSLPLRGVTELPKISKKLGSQTKVPSDLADTDSLRLKLLKKLKAKKKKLEKLNQVLGHQGSLGGKSTSRPDSTVLESYAVSSSTSAYDSPTYDEFFADLLSPATTASNLSPDSTGLVETVTNGQEGGGDMTNGGLATGGEYQEMAVTPQLGSSFAQQVGESPMTTTNDNFLEEFISGTSLAPTEMETDALSALDLFF